MHSLRAYAWSSVDVDSGEVLTIYASWSRNILIAMRFLRMVLGRCVNKLLIIVDRGSWYRWALERLGLKYKYQRFSLRNSVERFFRYLKERTIVFHHKLSARNHIEGITNIKPFLNLFTLYYQATRTGVSKKCLFGHYHVIDKNYYKYRRE
jgi:transposase-like protein